jgi:hypothetical protein
MPPAPVWVCTLWTLAMLALLGTLLSPLPWWARLGGTTATVMTLGSWLLGQRRPPWGRPSGMRGDAWSPWVCGAGLSMAGSAWLMLWELLWAPAASWMQARREALAFLDQPDLPTAGLILVVVVLMPAFFEEWLFRGALVQSLEGHGTRRVRWWSAVSFALIHVDPFAFLPLLTTGWLAHAAMHRRGGCWWSAVALHASLNGTSAFVLTQLPRLVDRDPMGGLPALGLGLCGAALVAISIGGWRPSAA